jgi:response regulator RpfG family c-di-GMP phosphodiesterase
MASLGRGADDVITKPIDPRFLLARVKAALRTRRAVLGMEAAHQVIAIVDAFDAMTQYRPYREARSISEAIEKLRRERGRQFDAQLVDEFVHVIEWDGLL